MPFHRTYLVLGSEVVHRFGVEPTKPGYNNLVVQFSNNMAVYFYTDVKDADIMAVIGAERIGSVFAERIRKNYKGLKLTAAEIKELPL